MLLPEKLGDMEGTADAQYWAGFVRPKMLFWGILNVALT